MEQEGEYNDEGISVKKVSVPRPVITRDNPDQRHNMFVRNKPNMHLPSDKVPNQANHHLQVLGRSFDPSIPALHTVDDMISIGKRTWFLRLGGRTIRLGVDGKVCKAVFVHKHVSAFARRRERQTVLVDLHSLDFTVFSREDDFLEFVCNRMLCNRLWKEMNKVMIPWNVLEFLLTNRVQTASMRKRSFSFAILISSSNSARSKVNGLRNKQGRH